MQHTTPRRRRKPSALAGTVVPIVVRRSTTAEVHQALFGKTPPTRTLAELKQGVRLHMQRRHARAATMEPGASE